MHTSVCVREAGRPAVKAALETDQPAGRERDQQVLQDRKLFFFHQAPSFRFLFWWMTLGYAVPVRCEQSPTPMRRERLRSSNFQPNDQPLRPVSEDPRDEAPDGAHELVCQNFK
jgi:hypothetical protein